MTIICPACRAVHVQGTMFCEQCGTSLIGVLPVDDARAGGAHFAPSSQPLHEPPGEPAAPGRNAAGPPAVAVAASSDAADMATTQPVEEGPNTMPLAAAQDRDTGRLSGSVPTRLRVLVLNTGRLTEWIDDQSIHIGRTDRSANVFPSIDLDADGGHNAGVSRRHVRIIRQSDGYYLEDLGSINGTFLNRRRLNPGAPTELKDGDEVRLGNIVLRIVLGGFQHNR